MNRNKLKIINTFIGLVDDYLYDKGNTYEWSQDAEYDSETDTINVIMIQQEDGEQYSLSESITYDDAEKYIKKQVGVI